jgi:hypothetical protein
MQNKLLLVLLASLVSITSACHESKTEEIKSGRLKYVKTLHYGSVGSHGSLGWYVSNQRFYVNGSRWSPKGFDVHDRIAGADVSPNASVEAIKSYSFADSKETTYVLRMKGDQPEWLTVSDIPYDGGYNLGQWTGDGHWLLFTNFFFNVETSERKEIKGLPDNPERYFLGASPDLETIIYEEASYRRRYDPATGEVIGDAEAEKRTKMVEEHIKNGIAGFLLIDARTGRMKMLELKKEEYPWVGISSTNSRRDWEMQFKSKLVWKQDATGRYVLVYPK